MSAVSTPTSIQLSSGCNIAGAQRTLLACGGRDESVSRSWKRTFGEVFDPQNNALNVWRLILASGGFARRFLSIGSSRDIHRHHDGLASTSHAYKLGMKRSWPR